ncbi:aldo/keto reductase [Geomonas sp. RF6]|uniref:aldo/keto reductase n=1 Tax=Geomonas sp. RF6 TaxID=2897342 RepID=UPI001E590659|nr:aldo/keto reductase [Geomonas sp. RF6]UFS72553.1 aldo/keto reductase [Geomonas sp. RF6]
MEMEGGLTRRELLAAAAALTVSSIFPEPILAALRDQDMPYRTLGRTGEKVSVIGLGGFHIGKQEDEKESIRIIRTAIDSGINFMDNCWDYNNGASEERMGKALEGARQKVFLMSKIDGRDKATAAKQIEESLRRLRTDRIDLMQLHEVIRDSDAEKAFRPGGAMEALLEAKKAGKVRYIGFTGHKSPAIHLKMLETAFSHGFTFDTVQLPLNVMDAHFDSFEKKVLPVLLKHKIGVLGMKSMGDGILLQSKVVTPVECLHYAMSLPTSVVITGCDSVPILQQALKAARGFKPLKEAEVVALLSRTAKAAKDGAFEKYKTSRDFDGTYHNPEWLGPKGA